MDNNNTQTNESTEETHPKPITTPAEDTPTSFTYKIGKYEAKIAKEMPKDKDGNPITVSKFLEENTHEVLKGFVEFHHIGQEDEGKKRTKAPEDEVDGLITALIAAAKEGKVDKEAAGGRRRRRKKRKSKRKSKRKTKRRRKSKKRRKTKRKTKRKRRRRRKR